MADSKNKALPVGTVLRGAVYTYTVEKVLGQGSFGITYLASTLIKGPLGELPMPVAVKEFFAKDLDSRGEGGTVSARTEDGVAYRYAKAFQRESQNLSKMKHPGIVKVLEAFQTNGTYYYSMEYLPGGSLDDKVKGGGIPEAEALPMIKKIGAALAFMHRHKMMHLDLKPKNIMLKADGMPVIIDFGLSKQYDEQGEPESSTTIGLGTPGYAPIEQATQTTSGEFQPTLDIYALGATLYKMLTGKTPPAATLVLNKKAALEPELEAKNVSSGTVDAILKAMAPLMDDRPQSVEEFLSRFDEAKRRIEKKYEGLIARIFPDVSENADLSERTYDRSIRPFLDPEEFKRIIQLNSARHERLSRALIPTKPNPAPAGGKSKTWLWALLGGLAALAVILAFVFGGKGGNQGAGDDMVLDTLAVVPAEQIAATPVAPPVTDPVPESPGSIKITSEPSGATIWLDGKNTKKQTPEILGNVTPGRHTYKLVLEGYQDDSGSIKVISGQRANVARPLKAIPAPEPKPSDSSAVPGSSAAAGSSSSGPVTTGSINGHEWVDLGLSVKWAATNVGASTPEAYGSYFAWGETRPKSDYSWSTLKYSLDSSGSNFSKYNTDSNYGSVDNKTRLELSDDAARANWGGSWRMPTRAEQDELRDKCTWTWTTQGGKNGYKVTGKNGNSIFLPAAGTRYGAGLNDAGSSGAYWSSSLRSAHPNGAYFLYFSSGNAGWINTSRYNGCPVRPVSE